MDINLKISERTLKALGKIVTGDGGLSPYKSGSNLVSLFNELGLNDVYGQVFPSRWVFAEESIRQLNGKPELILLFEMIFDPREYIDTEFKVEEAIEFINKYLSYEKYQIVIVNGYAKVRDLKGVDVEFVHPFNGSQNDAHMFIDEQVSKCDSKISAGDYYGAISNARSLLEAVLTEIERSLDSNAPKYDGDLVKLYRRVSKLMNLGPDKM